MTARGSRAGPIDAAVAFAAAHPDLRDDVARARERGMSGLEAVAAHAHLRRELLMPAVDIALRRKSARERAPLAAELVVVGGGPLGAALAWHASKRGTDVLVVDDAAGGGAFALQGGGFRLNTPSAPGKGGSRLRDDDDLHPGLALPLSSLTGARFPAGAVLADAARLTLALSSARVKLHAHVSAVDDEGSARVTLADGTQIRAERVLWCAGFGLPRARIAGASVSKRAAAACVLDSADVLARATHDALPLSTLTTSSLAVIGSGPSALAVLALALGFGPHEELEVPGKLARARRARSLLWVTGEHGPAGAREARERMRGARPHTMAFVIEQAVAATLDELVHLEAAGVLRVVPGRATWRTVRKRVVVAIEHIDEASVERAIVDQAIIATGYASPLARLWGAPDLRTLVDEGRARVLGVVDGAPAGVRIGRSLVVGAALEELVPAGFDEPPYAGAYLRALPLVDALVREIEPPGARGPRAMQQRSNAPFSPALPRLAPGRGGTARVRVPSTSTAEAHAFAAWTAPLDIRIALGCFDLRALGTRDVEVVMKALGRATVEIAVRGLDAASVRDLVDALPARVIRTARRWGTLAARVHVHRGRMR